MRPGGSACGLAGVRCDSVPRRVQVYYHGVRVLVRPETGPPQLSAARYGTVGTVGTIQLYVLVGVRDSLPPKKLAITPYTYSCMEPPYYKATNTGFPARLLAPPL